MKSLTCSPTLYTPATAVWRQHLFLLLGAAFLLLPLQSRAAGVKKVITFAPGTSSGVVEESVLRGDRDFYDLQARAGQKMTMRITAVENNAAFQIYRPGYTVRTTDGVTGVQGQTLPSAGVLDDATTWHGTLPASGAYRIVVGGTRGNATYRLSVEIR